MAKTVAEIDGDSSGLVSELGKAKKAMGDLGDGGKKLTDQLREVADQADIAAGNLINKIGGPAAITAIGGIGVAFTGAKAVVGAFLDSSEKLFRSYGQEGQKTWEKLEQQMDGISGAFAKAVLGGGDMNQQAERMSQLLGTVATAADNALTPLAKIGDAFFDIAYWESEATKEGKKFQESINKSKEEAEKAEAAAKARITEKKAILQEAAEAAGQGELVAIGKKLERAVEMDKQSLSIRQQLAGKYEYEIRKSYENTTGMSAEQIALQGRRAEEEVAKMKRTVLDGQGSITAITKKYGDERAVIELAILKEGAANIRDEAAAQLEIRRQTQEELREFGTAAKTPVRTNSIGKSTIAEEDPVEREKREAKELADLKYSNDRAEQAMELDRLKAELERIDAHNAEKAAKEQAFLDFTKQMELDHIAELHAQGKLTEEEQKKLDEERVQSVKDRTGQELGLYMQMSAKQIALGKLSAKAAADMARSQLGNVIIGLGDKAMAEAGIMAAGLNPLAVPMAAAGLAAYAIGNAMMPTAKPAGTTPASEKAESATPASNNYAFNLRVDSVFADGESVARQFAMMQESARQRGLLQQGAY